MTTGPMNDQPTRLGGRLAEAAGCVAATGGFAASLGLVYDAREELAGAWTVLSMVTPQHARDEVLAEVGRRQELMGERHAVDSVRTDLVEGRWTP